MTSFCVIDSSELAWKSASSAGGAIPIRNTLQAQTTAPPRPARSRVQLPGLQEKDAFAGQALLQHQLVRDVHEVPEERCHLGGARGEGPPRCVECFRVSDALIVAFQNA